MYFIWRTRSDSPTLFILLYHCCLVLGIGPKIENQLPYQKFSIIYKIYEHPNIPENMKLWEAGFQGCPQAIAHSDWSIYSDNLGYLLFQNYCRITVN